MADMADNEGVVVESGKGVMTGIDTVADF